MAKKTFLIDIDLAKNQILNAKAQSLTSAPTWVAAGDKGFFYFDTTKKQFGVWSGTKWNYLGDIPVIDFSPYFKKDGTVKMTGNIDANNHKIINLKPPASPTDASTKKYVDDKVAANGNGDVVGPATSVKTHVAIFDSTTGKLLKDSGFTIGKSVPSSAKFTDTTYTVGDGGLTEKNFTTALKTKLDGIAAGAQANVGTNLGISANGIKVSISSSTGHDIDIAGADHTSAGVMSAADKTKLDGIAVGAGVSVNPDWTETSSSSPAYIKHKPADLVHTADLSVYLKHVSGSPTVAPDSLKLGGSGKSYFAPKSDLTKYLDLLGVGVMKGNLKMGNKKITGLHAPSSGTDAATKTYVDNAVLGGIKFKGSYDASSNSPKLIGGGTTGGVAIVVGDMYTVNVDGVITCPDGGATETFHAGDTLYAKKNVAANVEKKCSDWTIVHNTIKNASETVAGYIRIATNAEMQAGTANNLAVTPKKIKDLINSSDFMIKGKKVIQGGSITETFTFPGQVHLAHVIDDATGEQYELLIKMTNNSVTLTANKPIPSGLTLHCIYKFIA